MKEEVEKQPHHFSSTHHFQTTGMIMIIASSQTHTHTQSSPALSGRGSCSNFKNCEMFKNDFKRG